MPNYSPVVTCYEEADSVQESFTSGSITASVNLVVAWNKRYDLVRDLLENARPYPRNLEGPTPLVAWEAQVTNLRTEKPVTNGQALDYADAIVNVRYRPQTWSPDGLTGTIKVLDGEKVIVSENLEPYSTFEDLDPKLFSTKPDVYSPPDDKYPFGAIRRGLRLSRTIAEVSSINASLLTLPGSVNKDAYTSDFLGLTFDAETLMFGEPSLRRNIRRKLDPLTFRWDITLSFDYNPLGWNKFPDPKVVVSDGVFGGTILFEDTVIPFYATKESGPPFPRYKPYAPIDYSNWLF